ncbi:MAG: aconitase X [Thermoproteus sp. AZ2]|uniref:Aconitase X n=1 Tax=Thermoproteus sp. AZ2 TaxID=1609232 RepID=A0ACC6V303_9CREN
MRGREYAVEAVRKIADAVSEGEVVEVETAHVSGVSYLTLGEYGVRFIEQLAEWGAKVSVFTTSNPAGIDLTSILGVSPEFAAGQRRVISSFIKMGISPISTCAPYEFIKTRPRTMHAWAESNAITYINTFRDAWSDKNPGPLALLAAVAGFAPRTEMYRLEGRRPTALVKARLELDALRAGLLGAYIGESLGSGIPYVIGPAFVSEEARREFAAALSTFSSIIFAVIEGATPNWELYNRLADVRDKLDVSEADLSRYLSEAGEPDAVYIGCPHLDAEMLLRIIEMVRGRGPAKKPIYISTSPGVYEAVRAIAEELRERNIYIFAGSCLVVSPYTRRFKTIATDSLKSIYYIPRLHGVRAVPCETLKCIDYAYS